MAEAGMLQLALRTASLRTFAAPAWRMLARVRVPTRHEHLKRTEQRVAWCSAPRLLQLQAACTSRQHNNALERVAPLRMQRAAAIHISGVQGGSECSNLRMRDVSLLGDINKSLGDIAILKNAYRTPSSRAVRNYLLWASGAIACAR